MLPVGAILCDQMAPIPGCSLAGMFLNNLTHTMDRPHVDAMPLIIFDPALCYLSGFMRITTNLRIFNRDISRTYDLYPNSFKSMFQVSKKCCKEAFNTVLLFQIFSYFKRSNHVPGIPPDCDRVAEKLALLHLRLFPRPHSSHATECIGIVGEGTSVCRFKSVPTSVNLADRLAHPRQTSVSSQSIPCCFRCLAVNSVWDWSRI